MYNVKIDILESCCGVFPSGLDSLGHETWHQVVLELNAAPERHVQVVEARLDDSGAKGRLCSTKIGTTSWNTDEVCIRFVSSEIRSGFIEWVEFKAKCWRQFS